VVEQAAPSEQAPSEPSIPSAPSTPSAPSVPSAPQARPQPAVVGAWRPLPVTSLAARAGHAAVMVDGQAFLWGGVGADGHPRADGALYDPMLGRWAMIPDAPEALAAPHALALPGRSCELRPPACQEVFVVGESATGDPGTAMAYDPGVDTWRTLASPPAGRWVWASAAWTGTAVLVLGDSAADGPPAAVLYDPVVDAWRSAPPPPVHGWQGSRAAARGDVTYATGLLGDRTGTAIAVYADGRWSPADPAPVTGYWHPEISLRSATGPAVLVGGNLLGGARALTWSPHRGWYRTPSIPWRLLREEQHLVVNADRATVWSGDGHGEGAVLTLRRGRPWQAAAPSPLAPRTGAASAWTGTGLLIWGGTAAAGDPDAGRLLADGAVFHPHARVAEDGLRPPD
jgi:hypothetical protein